MAMTFPYMLHNRNTRNTFKFGTKPHGIVWYVKSYINDLLFIYIGVAIVIILLAGEKGGPGKTTLAVNIAIERARGHGKPVCLVDCDVQASATKWLQRRARSAQAPAVIGHQLFERGAGAEDDLETHLPGLLPHYHDIVIDVGGRDSVEMRRALGFADIAVFPIRPTRTDLDTTAPMNELVGRILSDINPGLRAWFVLSQASPNPFRRQVIEDAADFLSDYGNVETAQSVIHSRAAYENAPIDGLAVTELVPPDRKASEELRQLLKELTS